MDKFAMIIFGASGDLTKRKLMPALYSLFREKRLTVIFIYWVSDVRFILTRIIARIYQVNFGLS